MNKKKKKKKQLQKTLKVQRTRKNELVSRDNLSSLLFHFKFKYLYSAYQYTVYIPHMTLCHYQLNKQFYIQKFLINSGERIWQAMQVIVELNRVFSHT